MKKGKIMPKTIRPDLKIEYFSAEFKYELENILRQYLSYTSEFLKKNPWNCSIDIDYELAKTFDNLVQFKAPRGEILLAFIDGNLIGTASIKMIRDTASELKRMYVEPELQGQKIGQILLEAAFERSIQFGATEMYLESPPPFKPAHKLYRKNGFEMIKEYPEVSIPYELRANWVYMKKSGLEKYNTAKIN